MSDFDKEAEREKLREKYGEEEDKRAATEQMSELLLKGATMTNAHCTDCGDPIFRYDGQEFCPTCQKPVAREESEAGEDNIEVADPSDDATVQFGDSEANGDATGDQPDTATDAVQSDAAANQPDTATDPVQSDGTAESPERGPTEPAQRVPSADPDRSPAPGPAADSQSSAPSTGESGAPDTRRTGGEGVSSDLSAAESLLAETVHRFAQRAAESEDPRTAREHLGAAREAAEALDAVRF